MDNLLVNTFIFVIAIFLIVGVAAKLKSSYVKSKCEIVNIFLYLKSKFKVPLSFHLEDKRYRNHEVTRNGQTYYKPANKYDSYIIWGLTAMITVNFLNKALEAWIDMSVPTRIVGEEG